LSKFSKAVPAVVGAIVAVLGAAGVPVAEDVSTAVITLVVAVLTVLAPANSE
jgi:hypothetical protein